MTNTTDIPLSPDLEHLIQGLDNLQLAWLSGYAWAKAKGGSNDFTVPVQNQTSEVAKALKVTVLSASQTGNAKLVANKLTETLNTAGVTAVHHSLSNYKAKNISDEDIVILVTSTQGDGEPPEEGVVLYKFLNGKKAPKLDRLQFAVLGLGDSSYPNFCQAGKDFDKQLAQLGATRLLDRTDADLEYQTTADAWIESITAILKEKATQTVVVSVTTNTQSTPIVASKFNKENPFPATLLTNQRITDSTAEKDVRHLEFDLSGSDLTYQAGDALGVWFDNDPELVQAFLNAVGLNGEEEVIVAEQTRSLRSALLTYLDLTKASLPFVKSYAEFANNPELTDIVADNDKVANLIATRAIIDIIEQYPTTLKAEQLVSLLRPLTPRLYSISSSQSEVGDEIHLSVGVVRFEHNGKVRSGAASSYLADRVEEDGTVRVFVEHNDNFRLPQDNNKPIIMIGSGTGIAPYRAFVQQRAAEEASGQNWLIFGNQHFTKDFLYQAEWQQFKKDGYLHKYSFAWSRDQEEKIYVQDKIRENAEAIWSWLQDGAYVYVCGDATRMAKDVEQALLDVIEQQGKFSRDDAEEYLNELAEAKRYQRDIY
ncbi:assimilatory sulfite reductase (NADPH) flavoprotein subunit [Mannheimia varigena]|uniref:assimilatory sulfite reductase (NADPH) flavoprotein subunit n=1 Tax=Mannheimia varigena TaxID=85404 RepID=UPI0015B3C894|nr:assimilatory sulfite reductase (NADPH) flavoprotein subunit [Mannheimia varigena]QLD32873.1 assimilatory sulfite reductase (NADPH) flavoprotein subunit [Mannheimia varigena]